MTKRTTGRTGRAGRAGEAITLYTEDDFEQLKSIANVMKNSGCKDIPEWIFTMKPTELGSSSFFFFFFFGCCALWLRLIVNLGLQQTPKERVGETAVGTRVHFDQTEEEILQNSQEGQQQNRETDSTEEEEGKEGEAREAG
jgi:superfamily II DNA/RNA helicase